MLESIAAVKSKMEATAFALRLMVRRSADGFCGLSSAFRPSNRPSIRSDVRAFILQIILSVGRRVRTDGNPPVGRLVQANINACSIYVAP